jgi:Uncharacterized protein conserved in bacteria
MKKILSILLIICIAFPVAAQEISSGTYKGFKISKDKDTFPDIIDINAVFSAAKICNFKTNIENKKVPLSGRYHIIINNSKYVIANISNGILEGEWAKYTSNNQVIEKAFFKKGCYDGEFIISYSDREVYTFKDCEMKHYIAHYSNGKLKVERNYENEKLNGLIKEYYENGDLKEEVYYNQGKRHGKRVLVIDSDKHTEIEHYNNGVLEGEYTSAYNDGRMIETGTYDSKGEKTGKWTRWDRNGELNTEIHYLNGKYNGEHKSYHKGKLSIKSEYANGQYHGQYIWYFDYPAVREERNYKNGIYHGSFKYYTDDGKKLMSETIFENGERVIETNYYRTSDGDYTESFYQDKQVVKRKVYDKNGKLKSLSLLNEKGDLVVVQEYNTAGKATKTNKEYRKHNSLILKEDASGIIDIE